MAIYAAAVSRTNLGGGSVEFDINITYGGADIGVVAGKPEIVLVLTAVEGTRAKSVTHTLDEYDHDSSHLYAKASVLYNGVVGWVIEVFAQPEADTPTGHVYWASLTRADASSPVTITETVN